MPGWDQLSLQQKQLCYYLNMAGLAGRDMHVGPELQAQPEDPSRFGDAS
jgi:hypothetical protein